MNWEIGIDVYTLLCIKQIANENLLYSTGNSTQCSEGDLNGKETQKGDMCIRTADSLCCTPEMSTTL